MKAKMEVTLDTIWTNQVTASVECELDNPHVISARMLAEMMTVRLKYLVSEIRHANEVAAADYTAEGRAGIVSRGGGGAGGEGSRHAEAEREAANYEDIKREQETLREREPIQDEEATRPR